jgi:hypothetical protein
MDYSGTALPYDGKSFCEALAPSELPHCAQAQHAWGDCVAAVAAQSLPDTTVALEEVVGCGSLSQPARRNLQQTSPCSDVARRRFRRRFRRLEQGAKSTTSQLESCPREQGRALLEMETKDVLLVEMEVGKDDEGKDEKSDDVGGGGLDASIWVERPTSATRIHGALWASCSHTPGVLIGTVLLMAFGLGALWDAVVPGPAIPSLPPPGDHPPAASSPAPVPLGPRSAGESGIAGGGGGAETGLGWGWGAVGQLAELDVALAIVRTDHWALGQTDPSNGINSLAAQVRFIGSDGREIVQPQRVRQLSADWDPEVVVGRHLVLPNSATVTALLRTFVVKGIAPHRLRSLANDCQPTTSTARDLAPAYRVESIIPAASPGRPPQLVLAVPVTRQLPMAAFSVMANQAVFLEFRHLAAIPCFHAALVNREENARATVAHMAYMRANEWATSDAVFVLLCVDGWGGRVVDGVCTGLNGGPMDLAGPVDCGLLQRLQSAWTRLFSMYSAQPLQVQDELRMDEDRGQVFSETVGLDP